MKKVFRRRTGSAGKKGDVEKGSLEKRNSAPPGSMDGEGQNYENTMHIYMYVLVHFVVVSVHVV